MSSTLSITIVLAVIFCAPYVYSQPRPIGGIEDERPADDEVREIVSKVQDEIQKRYPEKFESIEPLAYRTQLVSGKNYFVKSIQLIKNYYQLNHKCNLLKALVREQDGDKNYAHLRIYKSFRGAVELASIKVNVERSHPLQYFQ